MGKSRFQILNRVFMVVALFVLILVTPLSVTADGTTTDSSQRLAWFKSHLAMKEGSIFKDLGWRALEPHIVSGRCTDVVVPGRDRNTIYVGTAGAGLWKTSNAGVTWKPIMDDQATGSIGDVAIAPSDHDVVWVGTGEANILRSSVAGIGVYKSLNAGKTWQHMGLADTYTIGRIVIHPSNPDIVYVAASGHEWTDNEERGVYKTTDGGKTWQKVFYISERVGAWDLVIDPRDPQTVYVSMWNRIRRPWTDPVPGPGDGLFKTVDGGRNWKQLLNGLPDIRKTGRIGIDIARSNPDVLYAFVDNHNPGRMPREGERDPYGRLRTTPVLVGNEIYRTDDRGENWLKVSPPMEGWSGTYGWVFGQIRVDPSDENTIYVMGLRLSQSTDGGKTLTQFNYPGLHGDHHGLWIDPGDSNYLVNVNDGGVNVSFDRGLTWQNFYDRMNLLQFYNVSYDMEKPFNVYGSAQDHGAFRVNVAFGSSRQGRGRLSPLGWEWAPGGEETYHAIDPSNNHIVFAASKSQTNRLSRYEFKPGLNPRWIRKAVNPRQEKDEPLLRTKWLVPILVSSHNPQVVYFGMQYLFRSPDQGNNWEQISSNLSTRNPDKVGDVQYAIPHQCITTISESPFQAGFLYVGTDDGRLHLSEYGGKNWSDIAAGLPTGLSISRIIASKYDRNRVYVTLNGRGEDDFFDYIFKSTDRGQTWSDISGNIPGGPVNVIREDPRKQDILYVGTDLGVYVTLDGGKEWHALAAGLPACTVWDLIIHPRDNTLVIATHGRGMWVIDDVTPISK